jgi:hypothetical protein
MGAILSLLVAAFAAGRRVLRDVEAFSKDLPVSTRWRWGLARSVSDTTLYEFLAAQSPSGFRELVWEQARRALRSKAATNDLFRGGVVSFDGKGIGGGPGRGAQRALPNDGLRQPGHRGLARLRAARRADLLFGEALPGPGVPR